MKLILSPLTPRRLDKQLATLHRDRDKAVARELVPACVPGQNIGAHRDNHLLLRLEVRPAAPQAWSTPESTGVNHIGGVSRFEGLQGACA